MRARLMRGVVEDVLDVPERSPGHALAGDGVVRRRYVIEQREQPDQ